jgi:hypothetical protein
LALGNGVNVRRQSEGDDVGLETVNDGAGLFARAAVRLLDLDGVAGLGLPSALPKGHESYQFC